MILIVGGMGFIGLHTARRFLDAGENVVITQFQISAGSRTSSRTSWGNASLSSVSMCPTPMA